MPHSANHVVKRMTYFNAEIDRLVMMCDDNEEILMLGSCLMTSAKSLFDGAMGSEKRKTLIDELNKTD
jgi:hypothetical protein